MITDKCGGDGGEETYITRERGGERRALRCDTREQLSTAGSFGRLSFVSMSYPISRLSRTVDEEEDNNQMELIEEATQKEARDVTTWDGARRTDGRRRETLLVLVQG